MKTRKKRSVSRSQRKVGGVKRSNSKKKGARVPKRIRTRGKVRSKKTAKKEYKLRSSGQKKRGKRRVDRRTLKKKKMISQQKYDVIPISYGEEHRRPSCIQRVALDIPDRSVSSVKR